ncbi:hypothetical protein LSAT2_023766 [Lamellibrachia satsuma]|nr:hypothetical protein LSAT2_023766 [Lamellibrachia satsuma]
MEQAQNETVDQFVSRLRQKAISCGFGNVDEAIRDQVIEKCSNKPKWRGKGNDSVTGRTTSHRQTEQRCYRCNRQGHFARNAQCPARDQVCKRCGKRGHYAVCCKTQGSGRPKWKTSDTTNPKVKTCYKVTGNRQGENRDDYAFTVDNTGNESGVVDLKVGGVAITSILIDSGATCNIMDKATWEMLKKEGVKYVSRRTNKKLFAYGQEKPIDVLGTFVAEIECENNDRKCEGQFTVIKGTGKTLLGRRTAEKLDVLRIGPLEHPHTFSVTEEGTDADIRWKFADVFAGVGKLKNYQLKVRWAVISFFACSGPANLLRVTLVIAVIVFFRVSRRDALLLQVGRAFIDANMAAFLTACVAGMFYSDTPAILPRSNIGSKHTSKYLNGT